MQGTSRCCPSCDEPLGISWDMWGQFYVCQECGFTAEDDNELDLDFKGGSPHIPLWAAPVAGHWALARR